ncbi:MAG TPA: VanZ family protein [bacterium]|nr:VanZ family protein [bacterium]
MNRHLSHHSFWLPSILSMYILFLVLMTMAPYNFSEEWLRLFLDGEIRSQIVHFHVYDLLNNLILFIPMGLILKSLNPSFGWKRTILIGGMVSLTIETLQLFLPRTTSLNDLFMNSVGTGVGWVIAEKQLINLNRWSIGSGIRRGMALAAMLIVLILLQLPFFVNSLEGWDEHFHLMAGNEESLDRPWAGRIMGFRIHDRTLKTAEVDRRFQAGVDGFFFESGGIAACDFTAGSVSKEGFMPDSMIQEGVFLDEEGMVFDGKSRFRSAMPAKEISRQLKAKPAFSIEIWLQTFEILQEGPARILSLSGGTDSRNFTLGQSSSGLQFRVRTPLAGANGSRICLFQENIFQDTLAHHIVATFNRGVQKIYVDGRSVPGHIGSLHYLLRLLHLGDTRFSWAAMSVLLFTPTGFFLAWPWSRQRILRGMTATVLFIALAAAYGTMQGQPFHLFYAFALAAALPGAVLARMHEPCRSPKYDGLQ